jgi:PAS domain S-box-containing protein
LDITDRKEAEEALRDSEVKYRTLYSSMNEGVALHEIIYDDDGAAIDYLFLDVNPAYEKILGLEQEKVIARKATEVYRTDEAPFLDIYARVASSGDPVVFEEHVESLKKTFRISVFSPGPGRFATIFEDTTEYKRFEDRIKMLGRLPEENPSPVLRVDTDGVLIYANEQSRQLLLDWNIEVSKRIPDQWRRTAKEALESDEQNEIEFECGAATYLMFIKPIVEAGYVNLYALDITDHRRTEKALLESEEQLRHAQKMEAIGRLAGSVAHDFNNLISVITGHAELLLRRLDSDSPLSHNVCEIKETADRAYSLTRQLLAFSRKQVLAPKVLNINDVVGNVQTMLQRLIGENIELVTANDKTIATANAVFDEKNARELGINAGPYIRLTVSDTGTGIGEDTIAHIFEPFFTTKEAGKGTGLGLSTVYGIITQSGGHIKVESEPGGGTTFIIYLPQVDISVETTAADSAAEPSFRREEIILVVEDEESVRDMVCKTLQSMGHEIITAHDGADALEKYKQHTGTIHLLLTDVVMPHMSGIDLAETLIAQHPDLKVIFMSGYTSSDVVKESPAGKGSSFLEKPFALDHLCHTVRAVLDQPTPQLQQTP